MYIKKILLAAAIMGIIGLSIFSYIIYSSIFSPNTSLDTEKISVYIKTGSDYTAVRNQLDTLVEDISSFDAVAKRKGYVDNVKAGRFVISKGMNNNDLVNTLRSKNSPIKLRFNNQERLENLAGRIATQIEADSLSLLKALKNEEFLKEHNFSRPESRDTRRSIWHA